MRQPSCFTESLSLRLAAALAILVLPGCSLLYRHSHHGSAFTLHTDRSPDLLARVAPRVESMYDGFRGVFGLERARLGRTRIILEGEDSDVLDLTYAPAVLGYYLPFFNYIAVDTDSVLPQGDEMLEQVLLHEVAHHFIVTDLPAASERCWLNEGLAGALETTVFDGRSFEVHLLNPALFQVAQRQVFSEEPPSLSEILTLDWGAFHAPAAKERHYALAWSIVYFLLTEHLPAELPVAERLEALYRLDVDAIGSLQGRWQQFLRSFDMTGHLLRLATDTSPTAALTARWATRQLGCVRLLDERRALVGLARLFDAQEPEQRRVAQASFLRKLALVSHTFVVEDARVRRGVERILAALGDPAEPASWRAEMARLLADHAAGSDLWIASLVQMLADQDGRLRAAAAWTLSRVAAKPTIINPSFWQRAPEAERSREVAEWRSWLGACPGTPDPVRGHGP